MISVIIPTYNRSEILNKCLQALENQTLTKNQFEVVIVNDGSTDNTEEIIQKTQNELDIEIRYYKQKNKGQGTARNFALKKVKGDIVVFIGDDILVTENFLEEHLKYHKDHPEKNAAVLGYITWHPEIEITPFMYFLEHGGHQFSYDKLKGSQKADFNFFYTSNISLKREILGGNPFDQDFKKYGWEDIELGYRLTKEQNLELYYNPQAIGYHHHEIPESSFRDRMYSVGRSAHIFHKKHPELQKVPPFWKYFLLKLGANRLSAATARLINRNLHYKILTKKYFLEGLESSINKPRS